METMKSDASKTNSKGAPPDAPKVTGDPLVDGIPIFELRFCVQGGRDLPLPDANGGMGTLRARENRKITYLHKLRFYRVTQTSLDPTVKTLTFYIPETWATFQPLE